HVHVWLGSCEEAEEKGETHVRRFIGSTLVALGAWGGGAVATPLAGQASLPASHERSHAIRFGFLATLRAHWQIESSEVGYVWRPSHGLAAIGLAARGGTFVNESMMFGGRRGLVGAVALSARTAMKSIAQFGADENGTGIGFDLTLEISGYAASA